MEDTFVATLRPYLKFAGDGDIGADTPLRDLGLDSMREIELLFALEDTYDVSVPDDKLTRETFATGRSLWTVIAGLRASGGDGS